MKPIRIAAVNVRRLVRDRVGVFFVFVFPVVLILLIGVSFGGDFTPTLGVVSLPDEGTLADELIDSMRSQDAVEVETFDDRAALDDAVERGLAQAGVVVPEGYEETLRSDGTAGLVYVSRPGDLSEALRTTVESAVGEQSARIRAARFASSRGLDFDEALERASVVERALPAVTVSQRIVGDGAVEPEGQFTSGASTQLVLFVFVNSLAGTVALIQVRRLGLSRRMLSTPTGAGSIVIGEGLGRFLIAMIQALFIVIVARVLFDVDWGDPLGSAAVIIAFCLVATGAAMLFGAILSNESQAGALTPFALALAALGGSMVPLEVFSPTMRTIAKITPHAWANDAFNELLGQGAGLIDVLPQIGVLLVFAAVLLVGASLALRRSIVA